MESVFDAVEAFTAGAPQADDITLVALRYCGPDGGNRDARTPAP